MNQSLSEMYRCNMVEVQGVSDDLAWWKREIKIVLYIGETLSVFGFLMLMLTAYLFPAWRRNDQTKFWIQMCFAYLVFTLVYVNRNLDKCKTPFVVFASIYLGQVAFCWMLAGAWLANRRLVIVFGAQDNRLMLKASLFSWLSPLPFDCLRLALDMTEQPDILFTHKKFKVHIGCFTTNMKDILNYVYFLKDVGMYFPVVFAIAASVLIYARVLYVLWKHRRSAQNRQDLYGTAGIVLLFVLMSGIQFMFVILYRFYTYTRLDLFLAAIVTFNVFINSFLFIFAIKSTREMWSVYVKSILCRNKNNNEISL